MSREDASKAFVKSVLWFSQKIFKDIKRQLKRDQEYVCAVCRLPLGAVRVISAIMLLYAIK
jgi:hypothetical protein